MKSNYPYPKNEIEFYQRQYSIEQLLENYDFQNLMAYYLFGMNTLKNINMVIEEGLYESVGRTPFRVEQDRAYFFVRTEVIKKAMEKMDTCQVIFTNNMVMVAHKN
jgi:hypothetical protein